MYLSLFRRFRSSRILNAKKDFYSVLGVTKSSTDSEIKKAYFALAKKYHPDVNKDPKAKEIFSEINTAYETLSDANKKTTYDMTGMTGDDQDQAKNSGFDPSDFSGFNPFGGSNGVNFQDIFSNFSDFFSSHSEESTSFKGEDIMISLEISFLDAVKGKQTSVSVGRKIQCGACKGSKIDPNSVGSSCSTCNGRGAVFMQKGILSVQTTCPKCKGAGKVNISACGVCKGAGSSYSTSTETVNVPAGVNDGQTLRMASKGHKSSGTGPQGDLLIQVKVTPHPKFLRNGQDILSDAYINISTAALGGTVEVETLEGTVKVTVEPGTNSGESKKIQGKGIQYLPPNQHKKGDHIVTFKVKVPKALTPDQKKLYEELAKEEKKN